MWWIIREVKWLENLKSVLAYGEAGICPICGSNDTDYTLKIIDEKTSMGYGVIWCNNCYNGFHMSRVNVEKICEKDIPRNIKF